MSRIAAARRALPMTFTVYVIEGALATFALLPGSVELARELAWLGREPSAQAVLFERVDTLLALARASLLASLVSAVTLVLLAPWLHMSWLAALDASGELSAGVFAALRAGARKLPRAWLVSLWVGLLALAPCAPLLLGAYALHVRYEAATVARQHDLAVLSALGLLLPVLFFVHVVHDLARARALTKRALPSVLDALRSACSPRLLGVALLLAVLGPALSFAGLSLAHFVSHTLTLTLGSLAIQLAALGRLAVRSVWLAYTLPERVRDFGRLAQPSAPTHEDLRDHED